VGVSVEETGPEHPVGALVLLLKFGGSGQQPVPLAGSDHIAAVQIHAERSQKIGRRKRNVWRGQRMQPLQQMPQRGRITARSAGCYHIPPERCDMVSYDDRLVNIQGLGRREFLAAKPPGYSDRGFIPFQNCAGDPRGISDARDHAFARQVVDGVCADVQHCGVTGVQSSLRARGCQCRLVVRRPGSGHGVRAQSRRSLTIDSRQ
jgi:hypothetical protein